MALLYPHGCSVPSCNVLNNKPGRRTYARANKSRECYALFKLGCMHGLVNREKIRAVLCVCADIDRIRVPGSME